MQPARMNLNGTEWVEAWAYDKALADLAEKQRTKADHNHQFAAITDLFHNLPMHHAGAPYAASADAFRKHGLIATGHCDTMTLAMESPAAALREAPKVAEMARKAHGYALVVARGPLVICSTPHSQSFKAMGKELFQKSKADVLEWAEVLLGVKAA